MQWTLTRVEGTNGATTVLAPQGGHLLNSALFSAILFHSLLFYFILFSSLPLSSLPLSSLLFHYLLFHSVPLFPLLLSSVPFPSLLFNSLRSHSLLFHCFLAHFFSSFPIYSVPLSSLLFQSLLVPSVLLPTAIYSKLRTPTDEGSTRYPDRITVHNTERRDISVLIASCISLSWLRATVLLPANYSVTAIYPVYIPNALERNFGNGYKISIPTAPLTPRFPEMTVAAATKKC